MITMRRLIVTAFVSFAAISSAHAGDGNRLTYLDENNPWYPHAKFPKLTTPQWVGDKDVEAVVILAIDDMRDTAKYEAYLRPILIRLKQIDGRAPVSIMTCNVNPKDEQLQQWLAEGLSIEVHTVDHPCPLLTGGDFKKAKSTYDRCVDLMNQIPGNKPVAFRMPCCDSLNTVSPRFYAEIFNKTTAKGNHLQASSSVFNIFTSADPDIPRELVQEADGSERFLKYIPKKLNRGGATFNSFVNTIENYPYPYVINKLCWEFPCVVPSDWEAQHLHGKNNPKTVADMKAALDITVHKQGVMNLVFHPHGWIRNDQIVELIDHAVKKHGKKVKFLTFREAVERLNKNLLRGAELQASDGGFSGVHIIDLNNDGYLDVIQPHTTGPVPDAHIWNAVEQGWNSVEGTHSHRRGGGRFGIVSADGLPSILLHNNETATATHFDGKKWETDSLIQAINLFPESFFHTSWEGKDYGVRFRDLDGDGICELLVANHPKKVVFNDETYQSGGQRAVCRWSAIEKKWSILVFGFPKDVYIVDRKGQDSGLRFVDLNEDGHDDIVFSNHERYGIWLFKDMQSGWSIEVLSGTRDVQASGGRKPSDPSDKQNARNARKNQGADAPRSPLPPIVRKDGTDNGFFVHSRHLFWQNEDTANLPDLVDRRSFNDLLKNVEPGPKSPGASLNSIRTRPGFKVELVAAEPLVKDPVAFAWGADGKLWVVEMADYPSGIDGKGKPGGRIRFLEDTNNDGKYDKSTLFLDGVRFPNGILPWKKGVLVTAAPDIFYAEDTDGDGKADKREVLFTGFVEGNQQHRANGLVYGLDNWVYVANGDSGGVIRSSKASGGRKPADDINIGSMDLRINPDTGEIDLQAGRTQFGRNRDDWGNWFGSNNSNPLWHYVLADHYVRRNKHFAAPDGRVHVSVAPGPSPCFPISRTLPRFNDFNRANRFTSACSAIVYRDDLFGSHFVGNSFVSEPVHNLVHREVMQPKGYSFTSQRATGETHSEFLASSDNWFRPTMIKTGPDGALWIADMYRQVIEHPKWIPADWQKRLNLRAGDDRGRIYRVVPVGAKPQAVPRLDRSSTAELVAALHSANGWQRDTAQRLLIERNDRAAVPLLVAAVKGEREREGEIGRAGITRSAALGRLHALCALDGLNALSDGVLLAGLNDSHAGVRRHAVRLCERLEKHSAKLVATLRKLTADDDAQVRLQLAYTLGEIDDLQAGVALGELLLLGGDDRFLRAAVVSSSNAQNVERIALTVLSSPNTEQSMKLVDDLMQMAAAFGQQATLIGLLQKVTTAVDGRYEPWQLSAVAGLLDVLSRQRTSLERLKADKSPQALRALTQLAVLVKAARKVAVDTKADLPHRTAAVRLLGRGVKLVDDDVDVLATLLAPQQPAAIQQAAVRSLGRLDYARVPQVFLSNWRTFGPGLRGDALDALMSRDAWQSQLLAGIEKKQILARELNAARRQRLLTHGTATIRRRAERLFAVDINSDRKQLLAKYKSALTLQGNRLRGAELFKEHCSACHRLADVGVVVGPDLKSLTDKSPTAMLVAMLDPNRAVESKYINYTAVTTDGRTFNGLLAAESGNSITLKEAKGKEHVILRAELEELVSSSKSTMPEGLEKELKPQDIADVIAHVRSNVPLPTRKQFEGNQPTLVKAAEDGSLKLTPATCEIFGSTIVLEKKYGNLGFWSSADDHVVWDIDVRKAGRYSVEIEYACQNEAAGDRWQLRSADGSLEGTVTGTGTWDDYKTSRAGEIQLSAGRQRITLRAAREILGGAMIDLKSIRLKLVK
jgi:putative membrane-bound dehydrogenase-like protein